MMKYILAIITALVLAGCTTTPRGLTPKKVGQIAEFAAKAAALEVLDKRPVARDDLLKAQVILATLVAREDWDIMALASGFQNAGFKQINSTRGILIVEGAILASDLSGRTVDLRRTDYAKEAIIGALSGLNAVLR